MTHVHAAVAARQARWLDLEAIEVIRHRARGAVVEVRLTGRPGWHVVRARCYGVDGLTRYVRGPDGRPEYLPPGLRLA